VFEENWESGGRWEEKIGRPLGGGTNRRWLEEEREKRGVNPHERGGPP